MFHKKLKTALILSLALTSFGAFSAPSFAAGYTLNPEVKDATPALKQAAEIGVRTYNNPDMQNEANKDAILVLSFGTTYKDSRQKTIDQTVSAIKAAHPDQKVVVAFTSHIIVDRIKAKEGVTVPTPEQAMAQLKKEGYTRVAITSLDIIPGMEYAYDTAIFDLYKHDLKKLTLGTPLMYWMGQEDQRDDIAEFVKAFSTQFPKIGKKDAILVMAHGTPHPANAYYSVVQNRLDTADLGNVYIYSVEGWPHLDTVIPQLKAKGIKHVILMPMMMSPATMPITTWPVPMPIPIRVSWKKKASRLRPISMAWEKMKRSVRCSSNGLMKPGMPWKPSNLTSWNFFLPI